MMQRSLPTSLNEKKPCEIISGRIRRNRIREVEDNNIQDWQELNARLLEQGYWLRFFVDKERLHITYNQEACPTCQACKPARISIPDFQPTETQRRLLLDTKLAQSCPRTIDAKEHSELALRYQYARHPGPGAETIRQTWLVRKAISQCLEFRDENQKLIAGILFQQTNGIAVADFYYYEPEAIRQYPNLSLYLKIKLVDHLKGVQDISGSGLNYLYLGSWTNEPSPLSHKARLPGLEILENGEWASLTGKERRRANLEYFRAFPSALPKPA